MLALQLQLMQGRLNGEMKQISGWRSICAGVDTAKRHYMTVWIIAGRHFPAPVLSRATRRDDDAENREEDEDEDEEVAADDVMGEVWPAVNASRR